MALSVANHDIIFVSLEDWDDIWRRNQFICAQLAARCPERRILFVAPARDVSNCLRSGRIGDAFATPTRAIAGVPNLTVTRPLKLLPNSLAPGRLWNEMIARLHVRALAERLNVACPVLWLNSHAAVHMAGRMRETSVIYDITDDWTQLSQGAGERKLTIAQDRALCERADATIVCSERLFELKRSLCHRLHHIPNGVDASHYRSVLDGSGPLPIPAGDWAKPVLGYTGTIHSDRVDIDLVEALARRFTSGSVVLVGPIMLEGRDVARLRALPNVILTGAVPYLQIPDYMRSFDVAITPHRMTPFTESLNPIKLWEYLAAGKPIVSTNVAGFRDYPDLVHLADDAESFCGAISSALSEPIALRERRRQEAGKHSWDQRVDEVESVIQESVAKLSPDNVPTLARSF